MNQFLLHAYATEQYFYAADGAISFVITGVEKFATTANT